MLKRIWKDNVLGKVIAEGILAAIAAVFLFVKSKIDDETVIESFKSLIEIKVGLVSVTLFGLIFSYLFYRIIIAIRENGDGFTKIQRELRKYDRKKEGDLEYRWEVWFDDNGIPFINNLTVWCLRHEPPIKYINTSCTANNCRNKKQFINYDILKNYIESLLVDRHDKLNGRRS